MHVTKIIPSNQFNWQVAILAVIHFSDGFSKYCNIVSIILLHVYKLDNYSQKGYLRLISVTYGNYLIYSIQKQPVVVQAG